MAMHGGVFRGANSVADFFDPDKNPPLPIVEIPDRLNPYSKDGVRIYAKVLTHLPAQNVKSLPALKMLRGMPEAKNRTIVEASSGSTVLSLGIIARVLWGHDDVNAYVTNKKHPESLNLLRFFGVTPHLYGGLTQQEPTDETGIMCRLRRLVAKRDDTIYPGQYDNENNWKAHEQWTGPQILEQLPEINVFCTTVGTGGCITGTASYLKSQKPSCRILGVFNATGDPTPGPRHFEGFNSCGFPWKKSIDAFTDVASVSSYRMSMHLSREGLICGPSSGQALQGLLDYVGQVKRAGELAQIADKSTGEISCVFTLSDLPYQYLPQYFQKLGEGEFPRIQNEILIHCDNFKHDERWILDPLKAAEMLQEVLLPSKNETDQLSQCLKPELGGHQVNNSAVSSLWSKLHSALGSLVDYMSSDSNIRQYRCCSFHTKTEGTCPIIIDMRRGEAFKSQHLSGSRNLPLAGLKPGLAGGDLFGDAHAIHMIWQAIQKLLLEPHRRKFLDSMRQSRRGVVVVCYDGEASRLVTATLRHQGIEAFSVRGGFEGLMDVIGK